MDWIHAVMTAVDYIEENMTEELTADIIASKVNVSPFYFQKVYYHFHP